MSHHKTRVVRDNKGLYYAECSCRQNSGFTRSTVRQHAEDWIVAHEQQVERAVAALGRGRGSMRSDMDHAAAMIADPNTSAADKATWQIIYDGARKRLGLPDPTKPPLPPHEGLF